MNVETHEVLALKGNGFSRAEFEARFLPALAAEGWFQRLKTIPWGLACGTAKAAPFQNLYSL
jgi:hypothetical protein